VPSNYIESYILINTTKPFISPSSNEQPRSKLTGYQ